MAKIDLNTVSSGYLSQAALNANFTAIENEFQDKVLYRDNPSGEPNSMQNDLDMNGHFVINAGNSSLLDADNIAYTAEASAAESRTIANKLNEFVSVKDFGAVGDGVTDDTAAIQAAIDSNQTIFVPAGKYRITSSILVNPSRNRNVALVGLVTASRYPYTQQTGGPTWDGLREAIIFYDGAASSTAAVIAASATAIGTEPAATFSSTIYSFCLKDITLDANSKAGYGLFTARVQDLQLDHIRARGATVAGISVNGTYSGSIKSIRCYLNPGRGFELGAADNQFGWSAQDKINALYIYDLHADANGSNATFRESDPTLKKDNCGVFFGPHRSAHIFGVVSENNFGANIVFEPSSTGNTIHGFYTELGCKYAPSGAGSDAISMGYATQQWGVMFIGSAAAQNCRLVDGVTATDRIWLTGVSPTPAREESGFEIYNCSLSGGLSADWANYRLVNCALELESITGTQPTGAFTIKGGLQFGVGSSNLDSYVEGLFVPGLAGATTPGTGWAYTIQTAAYTKIGRIVFVSGRISLSAVSGDATGQIVISNLPFTVKNANNFWSAASISNALNMGVSVVALEGVADINTTQIRLYKRTAAATSASSVVLSDLSSTTSFNFSCAYVVA